MQPTFKTHEPWFATKTHFIMMKFKIKGPEIIYHKQHKYHIGENDLRKKTGISTLFNSITWILSAYCVQ